MAKAKSATISKLAQAMIPREMLTWSTAAIMLAALEGGLAGVIVKNIFAEQASPIWVNLAVAMVVGAPAFANILSFVFASLGHGRDKVKIMRYSMVGASLGLLLMATAAIDSTGLIVFTFGLILARVFWAGVVTLRASVWRMNFSREVRGKITSRLMTASSLVMAISSAMIGYWLNDHPLAFRWIYPLAAVVGLVIAWVYRKTRIRGGHRLRKNENQSSSEQTGGRLSAMLVILRRDSAFRRYMLAMMLFGSGNLMLMAPLIVVINEHFDLPRLQQILILSSIPLLMVALSLTSWAKLIDGKHILEYRAIHSWSFVLALGSFALAAISGNPLGFWIGAVIMGIAYGGAVLGWNLGHNDYSDNTDSALYMGIHVTLTGIRGMIMPTVGVLVYQWLNSINPTLGPKALLLPFGLVVSGALLFVILAWQHRKHQS
ncbi:MAG: MFS transporter [Xanthomonadales bacterium]|nr:MFS transporter [Xanthomonadales bacterium]